MLFEQATTSPNTNVEYIEVYPINKNCLREREQSLKHIESVFRHATVRFANRLAFGRTRAKTSAKLKVGKTKQKIWKVKRGVRIERNRPLARALIDLLRICEYDAFSRIPVDYSVARPLALRSENLVFRLRPSSEEVTNYTRFPTQKTVLITKPRRKISLPLERVFDEGRIVQRSFIPVGDFGISLPLDKEMALAMQNRVTPREQRDNEQTVASFEEAQTYATVLGGHLRRRDRMASEAAKKGDGRPRSRAQIVELSRHKRTHGTTDLMPYHA